MKTIAIDFDGVINKYSKGWNNGEIDEPVENVFAWIDMMMKEGYAVFVLSTRDPKEIYRWLLNECGTFTELNTLQRIKKGVHGLNKKRVWTPKYNFGIEIIPPRSRNPFKKKTQFWNKKKVLGITNRKLAATVYLDDRAVCFEGKFDKKLTDKIHNFKTWNQNIK